MTTPNPNPRPAIDYTSRDYDGLIASLYDRASQIVPDWTSREQGDFGVVLVDLLAYLGDNLSYQIDQAAAETFLATARRRESVVNIAALMNYRPTGRIAAKTMLQFTAPDTSTATVPAGTKVATTPVIDQLPVYFETDTAITFPSGGITGQPQYLLVSATEGQTVSGEQMAISTGLPGQYYALYNSPVIDSSVIVQVQDDPTMPVRTWAFVDNLIEAEAADEVFTVETSDTGISVVLFGDGITGKIPPRGANLTATYRVGGGTRGNVAAQTVTEMVVTLANVTSVLNVTAGVGGSDEEDIESIRAKAPYAFAAQNRACNEYDWTGLALRVPGVAKAKAIAHVYNQPVVYIAPADGSTATVNLLQQVVNFLQPRSFAGSIVRAAAASYYYVDVVATVTVYPQYSRESVRQVAAQVLNNIFAFNNPSGIADFGNTVTQSAIYSALVAVPGVQAVTLTVLAPHGGAGVADLTVPPEQIPQLGTPTVLAAGGITPFTPTVEVTGSNPANPTPPTAPTVTLTRCDASSTHVELNWTPGTNNTLWYVEVSWLAGDGSLLQGPQTFGSYGTASAVMDIPKYQPPVSLQLRVAAYNGTTGPVYSPTVSVANPCH